MASELSAPVLAQLQAHLPALSGPGLVLSSQRDRTGKVRQTVSAQQLVPVGDGELARYRVAVPVTVSVVLDRSGRVSRVTPEPVSDDLLREARTFAADLLARGAVRGVAPAGARGGPAVRTTHELQRCGDGSFVIRRLGFDGR